jgi:peptidoglycan hydrolase-like protein with peptidoglycan-binding domain
MIQTVTGRPSRTGGALAAVVLTAVAVLASNILAVFAVPTGASSLPVPQAPARWSSAIEGASPYEPQTDCDLTLRRGTVALMRLLLRTYRDSTDLGMLNSCRAEGMTSEHADGRALDLGLDVHNRQRRSEVLTFLSWRFAADRSGNTEAMARRLGVMYVIYNGEIRSTGPGNWLPYLPAICGGGRGDDTTCHRTHIHISLSWAGAMGVTSFWTGRRAPVDYGPCVALGHLFGPRYSIPNRVPCRPPPVRPLPPISMGSVGPAVALLQRAVHAGVDGSFGPRTARAVVAWKQAHHLPHSSATVNAATWSALDGAGLLT